MFQLSTPEKHIVMTTLAIQTTQLDSHSALLFSVKVTTTFRGTRKVSPTVGSIGKTEASSVFQDIRRQVNI